MSQVSSISTTYLRSTYLLDDLPSFIRVKNFAPLTPFVICWLGFSTAADISITCMTQLYFPARSLLANCYLLILGVLTLVLSRSRTGFRRTDTVINRLIRGAIQTGLFSSIFALADLFSFVLHRDTLLYAMFAYPIGRIYTNVSFLSAIIIIFSLYHHRLSWTL